MSGAVKTEHNNPTPANKLSIFNSKLRQNVWKEKIEHFCILQSVMGIRPENFTESGIICFESGKKETRVLENYIKFLVYR